MERRMSELIMHAEVENIKSLDDALCTPAKQISSPLTPRQSERKRALFPSASPQSSDLGPISPLRSSPDGSPVHHYCASPNPVRRIPKSPFESCFLTNRSPTPVKVMSPRKKFAELKNVVNKTTDYMPHTIVQTMNESDDGVNVPHRTPIATPVERTTQSEVKPSQPVTPSKKRSKSLGATDLALSPGHITGRLSLDSRSRSSELPKARTSLFADSRTKASKRLRDDDVYLTGRSTKRRAYGEINRGVRTGIRRPTKKKPPPPPPKPNPGKVKSAWRLNTVTKKNRKQDPLSIFPMFSMSNPKTPSTIHSLSSASAHLNERSRAEKRACEEVEEERLPSPEPDPTKRFFKTNRTLEINRKATVTVSKGVKLLVKNGSYSLDNTKKRRRLFNHKYNEDPAFEDDAEDPIISKSREKVSSILQKLESEDELKKSADTPSNQNVISKSSELPSRPALLPTPRDHSPPRRFPDVLSSPLLSPLSALASSTKSLSLNLHAENPQKVNSIPEPTCIPAVLMEEDEVPTPKSEETKENMSDDPKYFPIFNRSTQLSDVTNKAVKSPKKATWKLIGDDQYQIDAGQKRFGATECSECGLIYQLGEPEDEIRHSQFHDKNFQHSGWKQERIVCQMGINAYICLVQPADPSAWWARVMEVLKIVDRELGFAEIGIRNVEATKVFLCIYNKKIVGCLVAEAISVGYRMLISEEETGGVDCCSEEEYPVVCGVSRLWVQRSYRRRNLASQMMQAMRRFFIPGKHLTVDDFAFSSPTVDGKRFAEKYTKRSDYLVYI